MIFRIKITFFYFWNDYFALVDRVKYKDEIHSDRLVIGLKRIRFLKK